MAPTPSGYLHWGNAFSFVLTWLIARKHDGRLVLRIDDLDTARGRAEYIEDIFESLDWLRLDYDEGPTGPDDFQRNYSQSRRLDAYRAVLDELRRNGAVFACDCSRGSIQRVWRGVHPAECARQGLPLHQAGLAWRIGTQSEGVITWEDVDRQRRHVDLDREMRDFVVRRRDDLPAYQVTSLVDDLHFGINFIVRGEDLLASTAAQVFLANQIRENSFCQTSFLHHQLLTDDAGKKLSKSSGATSLRAVREVEKTPERLFMKLSHLFGVLEPATSAADLLAKLPADFPFRLSVPD